MEIEIAVDEVVKTLLYGGISFYAYGTVTSWTPGTNDKYKFAKGAQVFDNQVVESEFTQKKSTTVELDLSVTMVDYHGNLYGMLVGGRPKC